MAAGAELTCVSKLATPDTSSLADHATGMLVDVRNLAGAVRIGTDGGSLSFWTVTDFCSSTFPQLSVAKKLTW